MAEILIVNSDTGMRERLYDALVKQKHKASTASSGTQALEMLKNRRPQLILLDSELAGRSWMDTAREIRSFDDAIPIVVLRGAAELDGKAEELKRLAITDVLRKDLGLDALVKELEGVLTRAQGQPKGPGSEVKLRGTILTVDDDPQVQKLLKSFFESQGFRVILAGSGEEALQAMAQKPLAVLLDVNMPGMDGLVALKKIKAGNPKIPVIMASGAGEEAIVRESLDAGAYDFVAKPFNLEYLETVVLTKVLLGMEQ
jgi:DNA-binding response OmpR family regulator